MTDAAMRARLMVGGIVLAICLGAASAAEPAKIAIPFTADAPAEAMLKLRAAHDLAQKKEWVSAANAICDLADLYPDSLVPAETDGRGNVSLYRAAYLMAREELAQWPADGMAVWRGTAEKRAALHRQNLRHAPERVHNLRWYSETEAQDDAGMALLDSMAGYSAPARIVIARELLAQSPYVDRPAVIFALGQALHETGDAAGAKQQLDELKAHHSEARELKANETYVDLFTRAMAKHVAAAPSWPMLGGGPDRSRMPDGAPRPSEVLWSIPVPPPPFLDPKNAELRAAQTSWERSKKAGGAVSIFPAIDGDKLYYQDGYIVGAVDLKTGKPLPGWLKSFPQDGCFHLPAKGLPAGANECERVARSIPAHHVTLTDDSVIAILGAPDLPKGGAPVRGEGGQWLTCLNRATGALRWEVQCRTLTDLRTDEQLCVVGSPLVVGGAIYITLVLRGPAREEQQVICRALSDGEHVWKRTVFSTAMDEGARLVLDEAAESSVPAPSYLAYADGLVYAASQRGAVAAVDTISGWTAFVTSPVEGRSVARRGGRGWAAAVYPWETNPVIVTGGKLFALAGAGYPLTIRDAVMGKEIKRVDAASLEGMFARDNAGCLLAANADRAVVSQDGVVTDLNWAQWDAHLGKDGNPGFWRSAFDQFRGRGAVSQERAFIPTEKAMYTINRKTGRIIARWPRDDKPWPDDQGPGNILIAPGCIIVAGAEHIFALGAAPEPK